MKAVRFEYKSGHHLIVDDAEKPIPKSDEVLVRIACSALDTAHQSIINKEMAGGYIHSRKGPLYLGYHYSGTVEGVGANVADLKDGAEVFGHLQYEPSQKQGAFAEFIVVKREHCAAKPEGVKHEVAAAATTESLTALQAIHDAGGLKVNSEHVGGEKQRVLVIGAGGGVGSAAVQIAKRLYGAHVTAVCSTRDVERVKAWGADTVVDRSSEPEYLERLLADKTDGRFDVVFDTPATLPSKAARLLKPRGAIVGTFPTLALVWDAVKLAFSSKSSSWVFVKSRRPDLEVIGKMLATGDLEIPITTFKVCEMSSAMAKQADRQKAGRVVVKVEDGWN
mmetsp:Transcript_16701/g.33754  ORF Transcript_16701/g.33754 Transcript_16701/m.33754 type:complete len:336 (+) Transcript_16701:37-1044(+)